MLAFLWVCCCLNIGRSPCIPVCAANWDFAWLITLGPPNGGPFFMSLYRELRLKLLPGNIHCLALIYQLIYM